MKRFSLITVLILSLFFFVSCGSDEDEGDTTVDTGDSQNDTDTGDTQTEPTDTGDTDPSDPTNPTDPTEPTDPGEPTNPADPTDPTEPSEPAEPTEPTDTDAGDCAVISIGTMKNDGSMDSYAYYSGSYQPGTGTATADEIDFEIYSETTAGTYDLTEGYNVSYSSCAQCILVYEDIIYDNEGYFEGAGKYYYPDRGTMTVNSFSYDSGSLNVTLENVRLIQVTREYDSESDRFKSEPVENGSCIVIQNTTLNI